jgi:hypothetical protein
MKITLKGSKPPIWRRVLVPSDITLESLHYIIQVAMGWTNSHLHQFLVGGTYYGEPHPEYDPYFRLLDERDVELDQIAGEGDRFTYEYDFGDSWQHVVLVEKVLEPEPGQEYPVCIKGKRACPPEDFGGIWMYNYFIESMRNPEHPDYPGIDDKLEWLGGEHDPEEFALEETNEFLRDLR